MATAVLFLFLLAFLGGFVAVLGVRDPSVVKIVGTARDRKIYGNCYLTATKADILACLDLSSGDITWRFPINEVEKRDGKKVVAGDKVSYVLSYSTTSPGANLYAVAVKDGSLLWDMVLESGSNDAQGGVDLSYDRSRATVLVLLHNVLYRVKTNGGANPSATSFNASTSLQGLSLAALVDSGSVTGVVAVGCVRNSANICGDSALVGINDSTGVVDVTKVKSGLSSAGESLYFAAGQSSFWKLNSEVSSDKIVVSLESGDSSGAQKSSVVIDVGGLLPGHPLIVESPIVTFLNLNDGQAAVFHVQVNVHSANNAAHTLHYLLSDTGASKLNVIFAPHSLDEKVIVAYDAVASASYGVNSIKVLSSFDKSVETFFDGKIQVVYGQSSNVLECGVGVMKENVLVAELQSSGRIVASNHNNKTSKNLWLRQEALAHLHQAILLPSDTMKTSSSFFAAVDTLCTQVDIFSSYLNNSFFTLIPSFPLYQSTSPVAKPLCNAFYQSKTVLQRSMALVYRYLPSKRHSHSGKSDAGEAADRVLALSYDADDRLMAQKPRRLSSLQLQAHLLMFPHSTLPINNAKTTFLSSQQLIAAVGSGQEDPLIRAIKLTPLSSSSAYAAEGVRVVADVVGAGVMVWDVSFSSSSALPVLSADSGALNGLTPLPVVQGRILSQAGSESSADQLVVAVTPDHVVLRHSNRVEGDLETSPISVVSFEEAIDTAAARFVHTISAATGRVEIFEPSNSHRLVASAQFDPAVEEIAAVAYPVADDVVFSRLAVLGDDNILVKYLNPNLLVVCTTSTPPSASADDNQRSINSSTTNVAMQQQVFVNIIDVVSGAVLQRIVLDTATQPVQAHVLENFVLVSYWNPLAKRSELLSVGLYDGVIGKTEFLPFAAKPNVGTREYDEKVTTSSSESTAATQTDSETILQRSSFLTSIPLVMQRTYLVPKRVQDIAHTRSGRGLTNKNVLLSLDSGEVYSLDFRLVHPRRPLSEPTVSEREEGLVRYFPFLPLLPPMALTQEHALRPAGRYPTQLLSAASYLESEALVFAFGPANDVLMTTVTPSHGFDTLAADFNYTALVGLITLLGAAVIVLRRMYMKTTLQRLWQ